MLAASARLRRRSDFDRVVRGGRRAGRPTVVIHLLAADETGEAKVGFVVGKGVGNSVQRHRVSRQLRHLMRDRLPLLAPGTELVVRARPDAAGSSSQDLGRDIDRVLARLDAVREQPS